MEEIARQRVVDALTALSMSPDYRDRVDSGVALASFVDSPSAAARLRELILDPEDTAVTRWTVTALMTRRDAPALTVVSAALEQAEDGHAGWIDTGIRDALGWASSTWTETQEVCATLGDAPGARALRQLLQDLRPADT